MKVAIHRQFFRATFLGGSPPGRLHQTQALYAAKPDFADQAAVDAFVSARGGAPADWVCVDLGQVSI